VSRAADELGADVVAPEAIYDAPAEIFAPCALGAILDDATVPRLRAAIVAGSANNQLARPEHGRALAARGILYAPDYVINAGGIVNIAHEGRHYDRDAAFRHVARIAETLAAVFDAARRRDIPPSEMADAMAEQRMASAAPLRAA
jgi:leucine dehydrogenase